MNGRARVSICNILTIGWLLHYIRPHYRFICVAHCVWAESWGRANAPLSPLPPHFYAMRWVSFRNIFCGFCCCGRCVAVVSVVTDVDARLPSGGTAAAAHRVMCFAWVAQKNTIIYGSRSSMGHTREREGLSSKSGAPQRGQQRHARARCALSHSQYNKTSFMRQADTNITQTRTLCQDAHARLRARAQKHNLMEDKRLLSQANTRASTHANRVCLLVSACINRWLVRWFVN